MATVREIQLQLENLEALRNKAGIDPLLSSFISTKIEYLQKELEAAIQFELEHPTIAGGRSKEEEEFRHQYCSPNEFRTFSTDAGIQPILQTFFEETAKELICKYEEKYGKIFDKETIESLALEQAKTATEAIEEALFEELKKPGKDGKTGEEKLKTNIRETIEARYEEEITDRHKEKIRSRLEKSSEKGLSKETLDNLVDWELNSPAVQKEIKKELAASLNRDGKLIEAEIDSKYNELVQHIASKVTNAKDVKAAAEQVIEGLTDDDGDKKMNTTAEKSKKDAGMDKVKKDTKKEAGKVTSEELKLIRKLFDDMQTKKINSHNSEAQISYLYSNEKGFSEENRESLKAMMLTLSKDPKKQISQLASGLNGVETNTTYSSTGVQGLENASNHR